MPDERITSVQIGGEGGATWHLIHSGKQSGPYSLNELIEKVSASEIEDDDLVKQGEGLWTKASDVGLLKEPLRLQQAKQISLDELGRFHGIWISKKALVFGVCAFFLLAFLIWIFTRSKSQVDNDESFVKATRRFSADAPPTWKDLSEYFKRTFPKVTDDEGKATFDKSRAEALARGDWQFAERLEKAFFPEVTLAKKSNAQGNLAGKVHNGTLDPIEKIKLSIKTAKWERVHESTVHVEPNTTVTFSVFVGDSNLGVESFRVLWPWELR